MKRLALVALVISACCPTPKRAASTPVATPTGPDHHDSQLPPPPMDPFGSDQPDWSAAGIDWTQPPAPWADPGFTPPIPTEFKLGNGIRVLVVENHRLPLVSVHVAIANAGSRADGKASGLASMTADLLDEGAGRWTSVTLPEELERLGASLEVGAGADYAAITLDTMTETLAPSLAIAADVLTRPTITTADFTRVKADRFADLALRADQPRAIANLVFARALYGDHPYGAPGAGFAATVRNIAKPDVVKFFRTHYGPAATTVVMVGDVTVDQARTLLEGSLGAWKAKVTVAKAPPAPTATAPKIAFVDRPDAPQSVVVLGRLGPASADPDLAANDIVNMAIGGSFASRLNTELREKKGYTYGINSAFVRNEWAGSWRVSSSIRTDATGAALADVHAILDGARAPMPAAELAKAKALMIRSLPQDFETNAGIAGAYTSVAMEGRPLTYYRDLPAALTAVTAEAAAARADAAWRDLTLVVVGDWKAVGPDLAKLGLPIVQLDADGAPRK